MSVPILFVLNPKAGPNFNIQPKEIESYLDPRFRAVFVDIKEFENQTEFSSYYAVVAVGGDGTVNTVASKLQYSNIPLGILPFGSGNGLANHLNISSKINESLRIIQNGNRYLVDTGNLNGKFFINVCGTGFEAEVAHRFGEKKTRGFWGYFIAIVGEFSRYRQQSINFVLEDKEYTSDFFSLTIANGNQWGNQMKIAPDADLSDGVLEISILKKPTLFQIPGLISRLKKGTIRKSKLVKHYQCKSVIVDTPNQKWHIDGEPVKMLKKNRISILPGSLHIIAEYGQEKENEEG